MCVGVNFAESLGQSGGAFTGRHCKRNIGIPACAPSRFLTALKPIIPNEDETGYKPVWRTGCTPMFQRAPRTRQQLRAWSSCFDRLARNKFAAHARDQYSAATPDAARPGEFAGENSDAQGDNDKCRSRQNDHGQSDYYQAESNRADEKSTQCRSAVESEARDPFLKPTIHSLIVRYRATNSVSRCSKCGGT